jgi:hypothetical protein
MCVDWIDEVGPHRMNGDRIARANIHDLESQVVRELPATGWLAANCIEPRQGLAHVLRRAFRVET